MSVSKQNKKSVLPRLIVSVFLLVSILFGIAWVYKVPMISQEIKQVVQQRLNEKGFDAVDVVMDGRDVLIAGMPSGDKSEDIHNIVQSVEGVRFVMNQLQLSEDNDASQVISKEKGSESTKAVQEDTSKDTPKIEEKVPETAKAAKTESAKELNKALESSEAVSEIVEENVTSSTAKVDKAISKPIDVAEVKAEAVEEDEEKLAIALENIPKGTMTALPSDEAEDNKPEPELVGSNSEEAPNAPRTISSVAKVDTHEASTSKAITPIAESDSKPAPIAKISTLEPVIEETPKIVEQEQDKTADKITLAKNKVTMPTGYAELLAAMEKSMDKDTKKEEESDTNNNVEKESSEPPQKTVEEVSTSNTDNEAEQKEEKRAKPLIKRITTNKVVENKDRQQPEEIMGIPLSQIEFAKGSDRFKGFTEGTLDQLVQKLEQKTAVSLDIIVHAQDSKLAMSRARKIQDYLVNKGIKGERLVPKGVSVADIPEQKVKMKLHTN